MKSIFTDKKKTPTEADLKKALGSTFQYWQELETHTYKAFPAATAAWHYSSDRYGWSFRISDKTRVLVYLLPRAGFFKVALVFGQKATNEILSGTVSDTIKNELSTAKVYAEGRGIRMEVKDKNLVADLIKLIRIKIAH
jgi:hypothetical protein